MPMPTLALVGPRILEMLNDTTSNSTSAPSQSPCTWGHQNASSGALGDHCGPRPVASFGEYMGYTAVTIAIIVSGFVLFLALDRIQHICRWLARWCGYSSTVAPNTSPQRNVVAKETGLAGLTVEERRLLLQHMLLPVIYTDSGEGRPGQYSEKDDADDSQQHGHFGVGRDIEAATDVALDAVVVATFSNDETDDVEDDHHLHSCSICLSRYKPGAKLLQSKHCVHVFHYDCCMEWLEKHRVCPYCRTAMFSVEELQSAAKEVLGTARIALRGTGTEHTHVETTDSAETP